MTVERQGKAPHPTILGVARDNVLGAIIRGSEKQLYPTDDPNADYSYRRRLLSKLLAPVFKGDLDMKPEEREKFEELKKDGYGFVFVYNHFGQKDPFEVAKHFSYSDPDLINRKDSSPLTRHQSLPQLPGLISWFWRQYNSAVVTVTTPRDVELAKEKMLKKGVDKNTMDEKLTALRKEGGGAQYMEATREALRDGGSVYIASSGTRKDHLGEKPDGTVMSNLIFQLDKSGINKVAFVMVGLGIQGAPDYAKWRVGGPNFLKTHTTRAEVFTMDELKADVSVDPRRATSYRPVDDWFHEKQKALVPPEYLKAPRHPEKIKRRTQAEVVRKRMWNEAKGKLRQALGK